MDNIKSILVEKDNIQIVGEDGEPDTYNRQPNGQTWTFTPADGGNVQSMSSHEVGQALISAQSTLLGFSNVEQNQPTQQQPAGHYSD